MAKTKKSNHEIPGPVSDEALEKVVLKQPEHEERQIREYVEIEAKGEKVTHLEKLTSENILDDRYDVWDVWTDKNRYWVITSLTNLYDQKLFPSMDYTLSFHVGLMLRISSRQSRKAPEQKSSLSRPAWRLWEKASDLLAKADEPEGFQAVGMTCRECLLAFSKAVASAKIVPVENGSPKASDFIKWSEIISDIVAQGQSSKETRSYIKNLSKSTWQLVNWLTHSSNAVWFDGTMAVGAVNLLLYTIDMALIRYERGTPNRCPECSSYRVIADYRSNLDMYINLCEACGWTDYKPDSSNRKTGKAKRTPPP